ncbi:PREDICTED: F-box only protein 6-like [Nanorana parkeri]|uniref:F-box only protein 6-like n=1 Tax=Nanorana parkeri TaxID=125878 RepID=UPI0008542CFB|nr:PREDICTED: F-box only protein 6-like [Nanorana parkeri]
MLSISLLPEDALLEIFSLVPPLDLIHRCRPVCSQWRDVIDSSTLWKTICQRMGLIPQNWIRPPRDWKKYYYLRSRRRNLLKNACANEELKFWKLESNGGDRWKVEDLPGEHGQPFPDDTVTKYFVTSYEMCLKSQLIDLRKTGYNKELMDRDQPDIAVRDWFAARADCGCQYEVEVQLLSEGKRVLHKFSPETVLIPQWSDAMWQEMTHTFRNYGPGVRYVYFRHGGKDTQWWAGWYGIRVTSSSVTVEPEDLTAQPAAPPSVSQCVDKKKKKTKKKKN